MDVQPEYAVDVIHHKAKILEEAQDEQVYQDGERHIDEARFTRILLSVYLPCHEPVEACAVYHKKDINRFAPAVEDQACCQKDRFRKAPELWSDLCGT